MTTRQPERVPTRRSCSSSRKTSFPLELLSIELLSREFDDDSRGFLFFFASRSSANKLSRSLSSLSPGSPFSPRWPGSPCVKLINLILSLLSIVSFVCFLLLFEKQQRILNIIPIQPAYYFDYSPLVPGRRSTLGRGSSLWAVRASVAGGGRPPSRPRRAPAYGSNCSRHLNVCRWPISSTRARTSSGCRPSSLSMPAP